MERMEFNKKKKNLMWIGVHACARTRFCMFVCDGCVCVCPHARACVCVMGVCVCVMGVGVCACVCVCVCDGCLWRAGVWISGKNGRVPDCIIRKYFCAFHFSDRASLLVSF